MAPIDKSLTHGSQVVMRCSLQMVYQWTEELSSRTNGANCKASLTNGDFLPMIPLVRVSWRLVCVCVYWTYVVLSAILTLDTARKSCHLLLLFSSGSIQFCFSVTVYLQGLPVRTIIVFVNIPLVRTQKWYWNIYCGQSLYGCIIVYRSMVIIFIIHQTHYGKSRWSRVFNQFTIACELDMINAISAADIAFIKSSSTSAWLLSPLECSVLAETEWLNASPLFLRMNYVD